MCDKEEQRQYPDLFCHAEAGQFIRSFNCKAFYGLDREYFKGY